MGLSLRMIYVDMFIFLRGFLVGLEADFRTSNFSRYLRRLVFFFFLHVAEN